MTSEIRPVDLSFPGVAALARPHSDRVEGTANLPLPEPSRFSSPSGSPSSSPISPSSPNSLLPPVPARSPLRPPTRLRTTSSMTRSSLGTQNNSNWSQVSVKPDTPPPLAPEDTAFVAGADPPIPGSFPLRNPSSFQTLDGLLDVIANLNADDSLKRKTFMSRADSPLSIPHTDADEERSSSSSSSLGQSHSPPMTKRRHALQELLASERAYAADLALLCEVHIPLALGHAGAINTPPITPPTSSASSSRTLSTASDTSSSASGPPMTLDDTRIIFGNVTELAIFSESLCDKIEKAIGSSENDDRIGALFLGLIREFEAPYKYYITRHPTALTHLQNLPQTPALANYLSQTQSVASAVSHAWDLASLLIKPVQRLLKYPLLLLAIYDETPDGHPDKENLDSARKKMEEVARNVNEGRRRAEVVKEVLSSKKKPLSSTVNLTKMKSLRVGSSKTVQIADVDSAEAARVEKMHLELKKIDAFAQQFARNVLDWSRSMSNVMVALRVWAISFGKVIGLSSEQGSEAFDAFLALVEEQLMPLCVNLEATVNEKLLKEIAHLLTTMNQPFKLIASMNEQEPLHNYLFTMNMSKGRPPPQLVEASNNYRALRGQLAAELPEYLGLMHRGIRILISRLVDIQTDFWRGVRDRWGELWDMLRVEGEMNAGHSETINVWRMRWREVDDVLSAINITQRRRIHAEATGRRRHSAHSNGDSPPSKKQNTSNIMNLLASLEPVHTSGAHPSPQPPSTPVRTRPRGSSDASTYSSKQRSVGRRASNESLQSGKTKKGRSPRRKNDEFAEYLMATSQMPFVFPPIPRTKSMPLPIGSPARRPSSSRKASAPSPGTDADSTLVHNNGASPEHHDRHNHDGRRSQDYDRDRDRGRSSRKASLKKRNPGGSISSSTGAGADSPKRSSGSRHLAESFKSIASLFNSGFSSSTVTVASDESWLLTNTPQDPRPLTQSQRDSWMNKEAKYICRVIHACRPPASVSYFSFPFFTLVEGNLYEVLQEAGHPSIHPKLPLYVDDGEDCLLLCRDESRNVGWALASFLEPLDAAASDYGR
ncbi:hypothetical protein AX17_004524 [Amanita inopinata Kibby_2008]|nr:hypothetical protein AX17_004524 [Amanita inopinata Kibby_2008]